MMNNRLWLTLLVLPLALPVDGQEEVSEYERFHFFTECAPMYLMLSVRDADEELVGLEDRVRTMVASRLRAARLYTPTLLLEEEEAFLDVDIVVFRGAYAYTVMLMKWRSDPLLGDSGLTTGPRGLFPSIGIHGGHATFIMQGVSERVDAIIGDYLRVNGGWCD